MDNIDNERFYSFREPAWHSLGIVSQVEMGAVEAFSAVGPYDISLYPLQTQGGFEVPLQAILREPTPDRPELTYFGSVGMDYELISPLQTCEIFDRSIAQFVETLGVLGQGERLFITTKMPSSSIVNDPIDAYLLFDAPMSGGEAIYVRTVKLRVVCQNTLMAAIAGAVQSIRVKHTQGAAERLEAWASTVYQKALESSKLLDQFFVRMTQARIPDPEVPEILKKVYPDPKRPLENAPEEIMKSRQELFEYNLAYQISQRKSAQYLFEGAGLGQNIPETQGTAWGLYNAVVELEDYRGSHRNSSSNDFARRRDSLFGWRAKIKETAFSLLTSSL